MQISGNWRNYQNTKKAFRIRVIWKADLESKFYKNTQNQIWDQEV